MNLRFRGFWAIAFGILLALTSVTASVVRGKMRDVTGTMVLCTGHGPLSVRVDSRGQPVKDGPICPDFVPQIVAWDAGPPPLLAPETRVLSDFPTVRTSLRARQLPRDLRARGPPV